ncbi:MAG: recombinase family protein [Tenericutes bacterium]|nr:recombinase family protein [Mycoplasmatota bacterium]
MQDKEIIVIQPEMPFFEDKKGLPIEKPKRRVCAYARVSTDQDDQIHSYNAQIREFTNQIQKNEDWEFMGMYADEGISGTGMKKRTDFLRMISDARNGKLDMIITKSLSRFARNTVDCLTVVRELRDYNVEVFFEKENLYSSDTKIDFMLTIFSSIAQEEARNISENVKWGFQKRFKEGKVHINTKRFLGYDKDENGKIVINKTEAKTVIMIFNMYIAGSSLKQIVDFLTINNIKNGRGEIFWKPATVSSILTNEKYSGDAILQKRVVTNYLTHKSVKNTGQAPKYYIKNNHEAIIPRKKFEFVQALKKKRNEKGGKSRYTNKYPLSGIVYCIHCGKPMNRHYYNYGKASQRITLSCKNRYRDKAANCTNKPIDQETLKLAIIDAIKNLDIYNDDILNDTLNLVKSSLDTSKSDKEIEHIKNQITKTENEIKEIININVESVKENTDFYRALYDDKKSKLIDFKVLLQNKNSLIVDKRLHEERIKQMGDFLNGYLPLNQTIIKSIFKVIISTSSHDAIFVIGNKDISTESILEDIMQTNKHQLLHSQRIESSNPKYYVNYQILKFGV